MLLNLDVSNTPRKINTTADAKFFTFQVIGITRRLEV